MSSVIKLIEDIMVYYRLRKIPRRDYYNNRLENIENNMIFDESLVYNNIIAYYKRKFLASVDH